MASSKNKNLPNWGGGRSGFSAPKTPTRIANRNAAAVSGGTKTKGAKPLKKK